MPDHSSFRRCGIYGAFQGRAAASVCPPLRSVRWGVLQAGLTALVLRRIWLEIQPACYHTGEVCETLLWHYCASLRMYVARRNPVRRFLTSSGSPHPQFSMMCVAQALHIMHVMSIFLAFCSLQFLQFPVLLIPAKGSSLQSHVLTHCRPRIPRERKGWSDYTPLLQTAAS